MTKRMLKNAKGFSGSGRWRDATGESEVQSLDSARTGVCRTGWISTDTGWYHFGVVAMIAGMIVDERQDRARRWQQFGCFRSGMRTASRILKMILADTLSARLADKDSQRRALPLKSKVALGSPMISSTIKYPKGLAYTFSRRRTHRLE